MTQITKAQIQQATKIILVTYRSWEQKWYPFTLESFEAIIADFGSIEDIQIIERGEQ
jgi:hypothetical protein